MEYAELLRGVGRVLLGSLYVVGGVHHFFTLPALTSALVARGVPAARLVLISASVFQVVAGLALMLGMWIMVAAAGLVVFTVVASYLFLNFWDLQGAEREAARIGLQTNIAVIGGLLLAASQAL